MPQDLTDDELTLLPQVNATKPHRWWVNITASDECHKTSPMMSQHYCLRWMPQDLTDDELTLLPQVNATRPHRWWVNIGPGNGWVQQAITWVNIDSNLLPWRLCFHSWARTFANLTVTNKFSSFVPPHCITNDYDDKVVQSTPIISYTVHSLKSVSHACTLDPKSWWLVTHGCPYDKSQWPTCWSEQISPLRHSSQATWQPFNLSHCTEMHTTHLLGHVGELRRVSHIWSDFDSAQPAFDCQQTMVAIARVLMSRRTHFNTSQNRAKKLKVSRCAAFVFFVQNTVYRSI